MPGRQSTQLWSDHHLAFVVFQLTIVCVVKISKWSIANPTVEPEKLHFMLPSDLHLVLCPWEII